MVTRIGKSNHDMDAELYQSITAFMLLVCFVLLFLYSGFGKLLQYDLYAQYLRELHFRYEIFTWFALIVPVLEILVGVLMIIKKTRRFAFMIGVLHFVIMISFWVYRFIAEDLTLSDLPGTGLMINLSIGQHIVQNAVLLLLVIWTLNFELKRSRLARTK